MFIAQLAAFLAAHHHPGAVRAIFTSGRAFAHWLTWAERHGFMFQP